MFKNISLLPVILLASSCCFLSNKSENKPQMAAPVPVVLEETRKNHSVFFEVDSAVLNSDTIALLDRDVLPKAKSSNVISIKIEGYCDERGSEEYNEKLGKRRAESVKSYLVKNGVSSSMISTESRGETTKFDSGHGEEAWSKNRRVVTITIKNS